MKRGTHRKVSGMNIHNAARLAAVCGLSVASATDYVWNAPASGAWAAGTNWAPIGFPAAPTDTALLGGFNTYTVSASGTTVCGAVHIPNADATLAVTAGGQFRLHGPLNLEGTLLVNSAASSFVTDVMLYQPTVFSGQGMVRLNAFSSNPVTARVLPSDPAHSLLIMPGVTVSGIGQIGVPLENRGLISADVAARSLQVLTYPATNLGVMRATNGGILEVLTNVSQGPGATIDADGGTVRLGAVALSGTFNALNGGAFSLTGSPTFTTPVLNANIGIPAGLFVSLLGGTATINGTLTVNSGAGNIITDLRVTGDFTPQGSGALVLNAFNGNPVTAQIIAAAAADTFTLPPTHTISGSGQLPLRLVNNSTVTANLSARQLQLTGQPKTNNGVMRATGGGILEVLTNVSQGPGATIDADGGTVRLGAVALSGTFNALNGGAFSLTGSPTFTTPVLNANIGIPAGLFVSLLGGTATINGTLTVNSSAGNIITDLRVTGDFTPQGSGALVLNAFSSNPITARITAANAADVFTLPPTHTISGNGQLPLALVNNSVITAGNNARVLELLGQPKTNNGVMRATNGGILDVLANITQSPGATIDADGGTVRLGAVALNGTFNALNGGAFSLTGSPTFTTPVLNANIGIPASLFVSLLGGTATINGTLTVNSSAGNFVTDLRVTGDFTPQGSGALVLNAFSSNPITARITAANAADVFTLPPTHTISGNGQLPLALVNNSVITAGNSARALELTSQPKTNNGVMRATNGGILDVLANITQSPGARLEADGGTLRFAGVSVNGLIDAQAGSISLPGNPTFIQPTILGNMSLGGGGTVRISGGQGAFSGVTTINSGAANVITVLRIAGNTTLSGAQAGPGVVVLNAFSSNPDTAQIAGDAPQHALIIGEAYRVGGRGRVYTPTTNAGAVAPGAHPTGVGHLEWRAPLTMHEDGVIAVELAGAALAQHDRLTSTHAITLDGTLDVSYIGSYAPTRGDVYTVIQAPSITGEFINVNTPPLSNGVGLKVRYNPTTVQLEAICYADINEDGGIDGADVEAFFAFWESGDPIADLNNDGGIDGADVEFFFAVWEEGGC
ncbi:MAG: hypothetical protein KF864_04310 [Phycisphaeraceae bacterium]|nr:hypothetical protein [Phycisphaeraceae bacterium]